MSESITKKTVTGVAWTYLSYILTKGVVLVTTAVLTRLISQSEFGIVGFAITTMSFLDAVRDLGISFALIQRRGDIKEAATTAFWISMATNALMWGITIGISPFVADFFREPQITTVLPVLSASFFLSSLGGTHDTILHREMKFSRRMIPVLAESFSKGVVSIGLAMSGNGIWALVIGQIVGRTAFTIVAWIIVPWRPGFSFSVPIAKELFGYGYKIAIDNLISNFQANIDYVFIGRFLGDSALGLYTIAFRLPEIVIINLCNVIAQVLFPAYSILQEDRKQLQDGMLMAIRYVSLVTFPAGVGMALISRPFTEVVFGKDWVDAAPIMAALAFYGVFLSVSWNIGDIYKAVGRPDILWKTAAFEFALLGPVLYFLAHESAFAVSLGHAVVAFIVSTTRLIIGSWLIEVPMPKILRQFVPAAVGSAVMGLAVAGMLILTAEWPRALALLLLILTGAVTYGIAMWGLEREKIMELRMQFSSSN